MAYKEETDDQCYECEHYHYQQARMYTYRGDPGEPEVIECDYDWDCPFFSNTCVNCGEEIAADDEHMIDGKVYCPACAKEDR
jgi:formylmethanofuran dehydrogenase subunit E